MTTVQEQIAAGITPSMEDLIRDAQANQGNYVPPPTATASAVDPVAESRRTEAAALDTLVNTYGYSEADAQRIRYGMLTGGSPEVAQDDAWATAVADRAAFLHGQEQEAIEAAFQDSPEGVKSRAVAALAAKNAAAQRLAMAQAMIENDPLTQERLGGIKPEDFEYIEGAGRLNLDPTEAAFGRPSTPAEEAARVIHAADGAKLLEASRTGAFTDRKKLAAFDWSQPPGSDAV